VLSWTFVAVGVITILQQHILQTHQTPHTTLPSNMPTAVPDSNPGSNATITMSREDLMALSVKKLKDMLKERDLPAGHAKKSTLVDRFLNGKKKAPKSNADRMAASRKNRSPAKIAEDTARNTKQKATSRANRTPPQVVARI
jgi:hypothetical protein